MKHNIAIIDDDPIYRNVLVDFFSRNVSYYDIHVFSGCRSFLEFVTANPDVNFTIAIVDIYMPITNGIETIAFGKKYAPLVKYIGVSSLYSDEIRKSLQLTGAVGYCSKKLEDILKCLKEVLNNNNFFSEFNDLLIKKDEYNENLTQLNSSEISLIIEIVKGYTSKEIASKFNLSHRTIEGRRSRVIQRLGLKNEIELVVWAIKNGL
ncbi:MAG: response regulator transcription factor [Bacteroidia bacterium]|nr:response regulator transcription factor [Bacteroidia bacterium]MBP9689130.1 response regulator transcription factor [Bacteroidia bacterium]